MKALFGMAALVFALSVEAQTAKEIVQRTDEKMRGKSSEAVILIRTIRPGWSREMKVKTWMQGTQFAMIRVESPPKDKGIIYLKRKTEVWNWIPSIEKVIKLPPSMMSQSWMGTDFSNDDLVRESSIVHDYSHRFSGDTVINGKDCYLITMIPLPDAPVVWGKLIVCIDKTDLVELHVRFYDEEGVLINFMNGYDVKMMGGRLIPTRFEMIPVNKKNQRTEMIYQQIRFNIPIEEGFFTTEKMRSMN